MRHFKVETVTKTIFKLLSIGVLVISPSLAKAGEAGLSGGLSLLSEGNAKAAALGQAYTAAFDDIAGMAYNPASLVTLKETQASFLYQQGLIQDNYGQLMIGGAGERSGWGLSVGYYNGGTIDLTDSSGAESSVNAQRDLTLGLGYARKIGGIVATGLSIKYLQSTLIEQVTARAYAVDAGMQIPITSRIRLGLSALNYGTQLTFVEEGDNLPRMLRGGLSFMLFPGRTQTTLLLDAPYMVNEKLLTPSVGLETLLGPLAIRAGYKTGGETSEFSMGAGFTLGRSSLDYAFGLVNQLESQHKVSLAMKFGGNKTNDNFVRQSKPKDTEIVEASAVAPATVPAKMHTLGGETVLRAPIRQQQRRVYIVKEGDTLASIAKKEMGNKRQWHTIYTANKHLIDDPAQIEKGMRIIIP